MRRPALAFTLAGLALASIPGMAFAHAKLVSSTPAANATVSKANVKSINLIFNEKIIASTMKTELLMTGMPGMKDHAPMKIAFSSMMGKDGKSMMLMPKTALVPGTYKVTWSAAGADTHRMGSEFSFTVK
ncbi:copper homeostasis periplasmic binding protein CopC [Novosphingobium sp. TH158]|mgnify:FL=1|jgi:methionine-rich copper-binding protein CopC|uniref:copper homeostasis periplasmic binding protein CopC n=1 Tax=Novosphingobium sp. TH158 TaxID=2067455 RepID=UPI000C7BB34E|nr:copper homeostasis periplasmic binding protein CopC [Novosphingobium sp. TH158]NBW77236.1 copper resistance protein CopC [Sphingomonadaceae bacterium]PLK26800.1 copper resistance protein CopC [Novosphingobium sp. TH158]RJT21046.1 copper resistance protein CopC [Chakrabartia godavariana]